MAANEATGFITFSENLYERIDRTVVREHGAHVPDLAEIDPGLAYMAISGAMVRVMRGYRPVHFYLSWSTGIPFETDKRGICTSYINVEPTSLVVNIIRKRSFSDVLKSRGHQTETITSFTVPPTTRVLS